MTYTLTTNNKRQHWDPIFATVSALNTYVLNDLNNLDAYTLCTVHEQDSMVVRHGTSNYMHAIACVLLLVCYIACNIIHVYIACMQLVSIILRNFSSNSTSICVQMSSLN